MIPSRPLSVLVGDDEPLALAACRTLGPDILLLDINMRCGPLIRWRRWRGG